MAERYPDTLPQVAREGYTAAPSLPKTRILMDDGHYLDRREYGRQPFKRTLQWFFNWEQLSYFEAWFEYRVLRQTGWFEIDMQGRTILVRPITGEPKVTYREVGWTVALDVMELRAKPGSASTVAPLWPSTLPELESDQYNYSRVNSYTVTDIEGGVPEQRQRFVWNLTQWTSHILLTSGERDQFWDFYRDSLVDGLGWFMWNFDNGLGSNQVRCRFVDPPSEAPSGALYDISIKLESANVPMMTENEYNANRGFINDYVEAGYVENGYVGYYTD